MRFGRFLRLATFVLALFVGLVGFSPSALAAKPKAKVTIGLNHSSIKTGQTAIIRGGTSPNQQRHRVYLQKRKGSSWSSIQHQNLNSKSRYLFKVKPGAGTHKYRILDPATKTRAKSSSRTATLRVTRPAATRNCTPGYSPCIPPASDVDCAGGSGNGPAYVQGPVRVTGSDPYDLDRDGDGVACE